MTLVVVVVVVVMIVFVILVASHIVVRTDDHAVYFPFLTQIVYDPSSSSSSSSSSKPYLGGREREGHNSQGGKGERRGELVLICNLFSWSIKWKGFFSLTGRALLCGCIVV